MHVSTVSPFFIFTKGESILLCKYIFHLTILLTLINEGDLVLVRVIIYINYPLSIVTIFGSLCDVFIT